MRSLGDNVSGIHDYYLVKITYRGDSVRDYYQRLSTCKF